MKVKMNTSNLIRSGEKIWIFESVQSSLERLYAKWQDNDITTSIACPSVSLAHNLAQLAQEVARKTELEASVRFLEESRKKQKFSLGKASTYYSLARHLAH